VLQETLEAELKDLVQSCLHGGGGGYGRTCATRDDPRPVWTRLPITHLEKSQLILITAVPVIKLFAAPGRARAKHTRDLWF
jgi:hypothetical protein